AERALAAVSEERVVALLRRLVDVSSPTGTERACAETLAEYLGGVGVQADIQRFGVSRGNVLARVPGRGDGVNLMFCGHLDTSGPPAAPAPRRSPPRLRARPLPPISHIRLWRTASSSGSARST